MSKTQASRKIKPQFVLMNPLTPRDFYDDNDYGKLFDALLERGYNWLVSEGNRDAGSVPPVLNYVYVMHTSLAKMEEFVNETGLSGMIVRVHEVFSYQDTVEVTGSEADLREAKEVWLGQLKEINKSLLVPSQNPEDFRKLVAQQQELIEQIQAAEKSLANASNQKGA
jgi:hypothetical protein